MAFLSDGALVPEDRDAGSEDVYLRDTHAHTTRLVTGGSRSTSPGRVSVYRISTDGRFVVFVSDATDLVPGDTNDHEDVFEWDRLTGTTARVNLSSAGDQDSSHRLIFSIDVSDDGRYVAFTSAGALVASDTNGADDVFVRDVTAGTTARMSVSSDGDQLRYGAGSYGLSLSGDGRLVAFASYSDDVVPADRETDVDVFVHDRSVGTTTLASARRDGRQTSRDCYDTWISGDGTAVAFDCDGPLVNRDHNRETDVYVRDLQRGTITPVSIGQDGEVGTSDAFNPSISGDGRFVSFTSASANMSPEGGGSFQAYVRDRALDTTTLVSRAKDGSPFEGLAYFDGAFLTDNGRHVALSARVRVATGAATSQYRALLRLRWANGR